MSLFILLSIRFLKTLDDTDRRLIGRFFFINTFVSLAIPSLQLRLTTSLFSNVDSKLKTNSQYLNIDQCRALVLICSHILLHSCLAQIPLSLCSAFSSDHYAH
jgi:hypothetical protein